MAVVDQALSRTRVQKMDALAEANRIRSARAGLKADIKAGRFAASDILVNVPPFAETMAVRDLLMAIPKVGRTKTNQVLFRVRVSPSRSLGGLSPRQRDALVAWLRERGS
jgi:hypothetical protein